MATRKRYNFVTGTCSLAGTTLTLPVGASLFGVATIVNGVSYLPLVINPSTYGTANSSEIVYVTAYTANSNVATVLRGQEGTSALAGTTWPTNTVYAHGTLASDFTLVSGIANGDFPAPTASGQWFVSQASGAVNPNWVDTIPTTELSGTIPASGIVGVLNNATISGQNVVSNIAATQISGGLVQNSVRISGNQVVSNINATQISGGALQTSATILGSQVTSAVANATNATTATNAGTVTGSIGGSVSVPIAQISNGALPTGVTISGSQVYGALLNSTTISGSQIRGDIPAAQISGYLSETSVGMYAGSMYTAGLNAGLVLTSNGYSAGWGTAAYSYVYALDDVTVTVTGVNGKKLLGTGGTPGVGAYNTWNVDVNIYSSGGSAPTNTKDCAMYVQAIASGFALGVVSTQAQVCAWLPSGTRGMGSTSFQFDNLDPNDSYEFHLYAYTWGLTGAVPISLAYGRAKVTGTYQ